MALDNETGLDPAGIRVRPVSGLVAADYFAPGYFVWAVLIENLARIGYEEKNMYMAAYDWRLTFQNNEVLSHTPPSWYCLMDCNANWMDVPCSRFSQYLRTLLQRFNCLTKYIISTLNMQFCTGRILT